MSYEFVVMIVVGISIAAFGIYARYRAASAKTPTEREMWERVSQVTDVVVKSKMPEVAALKLEHGGKLPPPVAVEQNNDAVAKVKNDLGPTLVRAFEKTLGGAGPASEALARQVEAKVVANRQQPTTTKLESAPGSTVTVTSADPAPPSTEPVASQGEDELPSV